MDINDEVMRLAKKRAADDGIPLRDVVESALRAYLDGKQVRKKFKFRWRTEKGTLMPGVDLEDWSALRDLMDGIK